MTSQFRFEKLNIWRESRALNQSVYKLTRAFPKDELFAMTSQLRRAATSIVSNIAEGSGRNSDKDFAHFLEQAYGSLMETASLIYLAKDESYVSDVELNSAKARIEKLAKGIASLNRSLKVSASKTPFCRARSGLTLDPRPSTLD